jgi:hypothetical protein
MGQLDKIEHEMAGVEAVPPGKSAGHDDLEQYYAQASQTRTN